MIVPAAPLRRLRRSNFFAFYTWAFAVLHPHKSMHLENFVMAMAFAMEEFALKRRRRQLIAVPPRHGKSLMASVALCAWILGREPTAKILVASYGSDLASKHARDFRTIVTHPEFRRMFPSFELKRHTAEEMETTMGGVRKAVTPSGPATGFGANYVIIDDLTKVGDARSEALREAANAFVDESLYTRFDEKAAGGILAIQQRTHERDVIGYLRDRGKWDELILPALAQEEQSIQLYGGQMFKRSPGDVLAPSIESRETLEEIRLQMGAAAFSGQYLQNPVAPGGNRIRLEWLLTYDRTPPRSQLQFVVQSWDTALKEDPGCDFTVGMTLGFDGEGWLVLDVLRRRMCFTDQCAEAERLYKRWSPDVVLIEQASTGGALADVLAKRLSVSPRSKIIPWPPQMSKEERVEVYAGRLEAGLIAVPTDVPWIAEFRHELALFPVGRHDDQVDALFQFLEWFHSRRGQARTRIDPITGRRKTSSRPRGTDYSRMAA